ncbi:MAG TPA: flavodoxin [Ruminococcaceae bacterium]|nr:flavodoxin [Oscillospiraceae bacterium]
MKKIICIFLSLICVFSVAACCGNTADDRLSSSSSSTESSKSETASGEKTLVVYYSATGSTKAVAEKIAKNLNTDTFELVPEKPYTSADLNWNDENSRVSSEHSDESKREVALVKSTPDNWEQYDTVYVGYPIWWGIAAWPVNGFVKANDFTGKTVIPFCTSASSGMGESGKQLSAMAGNGDWKEGERFSSSATESEISAWLS